MAAGVILFFSGIGIFVWLGISLFALQWQGFSDPAWPKSYAYVTYVSAWLWMMPVVWLVAVVLAILEMKGKGRRGWLIGYATLPVVESALISGVALIAIRIFAPP